MIYIYICHFILVADMFGGGVVGLDEIDEVGNIASEGQAARVCGAGLQKDLLHG